jgi:lysophospholipase L1-like esterase
VGWGADGMSIGRASALAASVLAGAAIAAGVYLGPSLFRSADDATPAVETARAPLPEDEEPRTVALAIRADRPQPAAVEITPVTTAPAAMPPEAGQPGGAGSPAPAERTADADDDGDVTPTLEGQARGRKRGLVILQIGDSHTSADFLTGELRRRLQARYGRGAPGYITAGQPHIGVRTSSLKITASAGWSYRSLQKADAVPAEFWLSGYNAIATAAGETMTFTSERPQTFDMIEVEVVRAPNGGKIDVKLDGALEISYDLKSTKIEPVVIRLTPSRGPTEKVREVSITTTAPGQVTLASVAIYNKQSGLTYNSIGYPGAQVSLLNKLNSKLFANDLRRINPQIVVLSFGTNEAHNDKLDLEQYARSYERAVEKIKSVLPNAAIVVISPPDFAQLPAACKNDKASPSCGRAGGEAKVATAANGTPSTSDCAWRTPAKLAQVREIQHDIARRHGLTYWNWASIMPSECGAHRWHTASPQLMAKDHVHFTIEGYKKSAEQFLTTLIPVIEKVRVGANAVSNN